jgi:hypothetical protein
LFCWGVVGVVVAVLVVGGPVVVAGCIGLGFGRRVCALLVAGGFLLNNPPCVGFTVWEGVKKLCLAGYFAC